MVVYIILQEIYFEQNLKTFASVYCVPKASWAVFVILSSLVGSWALMACRTGQSQPKSRALRQR